MEEEFTFKIHEKTFEELDLDQELKINVYLEKNGEFIELPSNHWLFYTPTTK